MRWRLRRATAADASALSLVAAASFLETFAGFLSGEDIVAHIAAKSGPDQFMAWAGDPETIVMLAEHPDGAAPVGYTVLTVPDDVGPTLAGDIELRRIYTMAMTHGTGLGAALMDRAIADARARGAGRILLGVFGRNARARAFYERQGFVMTSERQFKVGNSLNDDCVYARVISAD
ncbi:GNAT family N-acetyltransferase [Sphingomonas mollis]|uniref:GNAT family N-acetyltransferase n=1 Tax=Sphingomonas mollis TaxID=2795726 RepID=A0ABS0XLU2_9SPHN|nr:GNAT family N-acetyltransferase [Sphingomonas sp. BT553]MBJ6121009.1 GNAT family N-acetyltransferase [Sphingomonas sp. BT553]